MSQKQPKYSFAKELAGTILASLGVIGLLGLACETLLGMLGVYAWTQKWPVDYDAAIWWRVLCWLVPCAVGCIFLIWLGVHIGRKQRQLLRSGALFLLPALLVSRILTSL